jgi:hypothetical protein
MGALPCGSNSVQLQDSAATTPVLLSMRPDFSKETGLTPWNLGHVMPPTAANNDAAYSDFVAVPYCASKARSDFNSFLEYFIVSFAP